jgi:ATP-dependent Lon protease
MGRVGYAVPAKMATELARSQTSDYSAPVPGLPVLALRQTVVFPLTVQPLAINRMLSVESVNRALTGDRLLFLTLQTTDKDEPDPSDLRTIGTIAAIRQMAKAPGGGLHIVVEGLTRAKADLVARSAGGLQAKVAPLPDETAGSLEVDAHVRRLQELMDRALTVSSGLSQELRGLVSGIDPLRVAYLLASLLDMRADEKQQILELNELPAKLQAVSAALSRELDLLEMKNKIESAAQHEMSAAQREYYLRQQLKAIHEELGDGDKVEIRELLARVVAANLPEAVAAVAAREIDRLDRMKPASPEYQMVRTYLDWVLDVPWSTTTEDRLDPVAARHVLDEDHYDLEKVKERIVEYLAVQRLKARHNATARIRGPILCFVGPPGVGKTSLGQSIARALNRTFVRIALGGVRDEAEIRGHRRSYIGAIPGRFVQALKQAGAMNPVLMLDEIDKLAAGFEGDPAAALLEVLDPGQNQAFRDHYLEVNVDLSRVMFIVTANQLGPIHPALLDRMEVIALSGYSEEEKLHIVRRYLIPRQLEDHGLDSVAVEFDDDAIRRIAGDYTREAGVRNLERQIGAVARKIAARVAGVPGGNEAAEATDAVRVTAASVPDYLGPPRFHREQAFRVSRPGVATGLAWTESGGDILFIEARFLPSGHQNVILTGQLGSVMQESARAAVSYIRAQAGELNIPRELIDSSDLHVHVPAGAIPKDGPSAGITMATAIVSALRNQTVREDVAMTGEITLSGLVLPVGGIREKALAARRHGVKVFILPARNEADLAELPPELKAHMTFVPVQTLEETLAIALPVSAPPSR